MKPCSRGNKAGTTTTTPVTEGFVQRCTNTATNTSPVTNHTHKQQARRLFNNQGSIWGGGSQREEGWLRWYDYVKSTTQQPHHSRSETVAPPRKISCKRFTKTTEAHSDGGGSGTGLCGRNMSASAHLRTLYTMVQKTQNAGREYASRADNFSIQAAHI